MDATVYYEHMEQGKIIYSDPRKLKIDLVLVDEGEGLVIDYITERHDQKIDEEGNEDA